MLKLYNRKCNCDYFKQICLEEQETFYFNVFKITGGQSLFFFLYCGTISNNMFYLNINVKLVLSYLLSLAQTSISAIV